MMMIPMMMPMMMTIMIMMMTFCSCDSSCHCHLQCIQRWQRFNRAQLRWRRLRRSVTGRPCLLLQWVWLSAGRAPSPDRPMRFFRLHWSARSRSTRPADQWVGWLVDWLVDWSCQWSVVDGVSLDNLIWSDPLLPCYVTLCAYVSTLPSPNLSQTINWFYPTLPWLACPDLLYLDTCTLCRPALSWQYNTIRDVNRKPENRISVLKTKSGFAYSVNEIQIYPLKSICLTKIA